MITYMKILGKIVGYIDGDTFFSRRTEDHWFRIYGGFGASIKLLAELQKRENLKYYFGSLSHQILTTETLLRYLRFRL